MGGSARVLACVAAIWAAGSARSEPSTLRQYLKNPAFEWKCDALARMDLCYPDRLPPSMVAPVLQDIERTLAEELHQAGASHYTPRIHFFLLGSYERLRQLVGAYAAGSSVPAEHIVCFVLDHPEALTHELNHEIMTHLWGQSEPWIAEGLAAYVTDPGRVDDQVRQLVATHQDLPLAKMVNHNWTAAEYPATVIYPELGSFVKYLKDTFGLDLLRHVWQGESASIPRVFGKSLATLERNWRASLTRR
jgi:hypothetical protein